MFETVYTFTHSGNTNVRVLNCMDCGGPINTGALEAGSVGICIDCGTTWRLERRA